jgi:DNA invertase Pin-like site-specific DNA recombinase
MKRAALYLRVSTIDQTTANQERELRQVAERAGWEVDKVYKDHGISGSKGRDKRPAFDALHKAAARREIDIIMAWSVGRSARPLIARSCCLPVRDSCRRCRSLPASTGLGHDHTGRQSAISNDGRVCRV